MGTKRVLVVSTTAVPALNANELALGVFGDMARNHDMNLRTWSNKCSGGRLRLEPAAGNGITAGVMTVHGDEGVLRRIIAKRGRDADRELSEHG